MTPGPYYRDDQVTIWHANALDLPIPDGCVDLIVTSPPYFGLRSYQDGGQHYDGQLGSEATLAEFVDTLIAATREMVRVLKPSGSIFVNLGDKYAGSGPGGPQNGVVGKRGTDGNRKRSHVGLGGLKPNTDVPSKSLIGVPWRYALRCIDDLGLILRAEIIWNKPNHLPESVTDRVCRAHETWFHLVKESRYFSAVDEIREEHAERRLSRDGSNNVVGPRNALGVRANEGTADQIRNPLGKLPDSVWTVPTQPLVVPPELGIDHYAAFPMEWPRRIIRGWSPSGVCTACSEGRRPVAVVSKLHGTPRRVGVGAGRGSRDENFTGFNAPGDTRASSVATITGYLCACPEPSAPARPAVVLDPFAGTGTTMLVAKALGRHGVGVELSRDYCRIAKWRCTDPGELARAMHVEKPAPIDAAQGELFEVTS